MDLQCLGPAKLERRRPAQIHRYIDTHTDPHTHWYTPIRHRDTYTPYFPGADKQTLSQGFMQRYTLPTH